MSIFFQVRAVQIAIFCWIACKCHLAQDLTNLDGNTFFIINKHYPHAKLAQWGTESRNVGTYEQQTYPDQLWILKASPEHPEYFYIFNAYRENYRIAKWGPDNDEVGVYNGQFYPDQLWKFVSFGDVYHRIYNNYFKNAKITKFGKGNYEWGTYTGPDYDDQLWRLEPRFQAKFGEVVLWSADNRQGSKPLEEEVTVTEGLKLTSSSTITTMIGFKYSLTSAINSAGASLEQAAEISDQLETSLSRGTEADWSVTRKITFSAPPGKNYRVKQTKVDFTSPLDTDNCALTSNYKVEETEGDFYN